MRQVTRVRLLEISPRGPGVVVAIDGREALLPAEDAAKWIVELGYNVLGPIQISIGVEPKAMLGAPRFVTEGQSPEAEAAAEPIVIAAAEEMPAGFPGKAKLARLLLRYPMLREMIVSLAKKMDDEEGG